MNFLDAPRKEEYKRLTEKSAVPGYQPDFLLAVNYGHSLFS